LDCVRGVRSCQHLPMFEVFLLLLKLLYDAEMAFANTGFLAVA